MVLRLIGSAGHGEGVLPVGAGRERWAEAVKNTSHRALRKTTPHPDRHNERADR